MAEQGFRQAQQVVKIEAVEKIDTPKTAAQDAAAIEEASAQTKVKFEEAVAKAENKWDQALSQRQLLVATDETQVKLSPIQEMSLAEKRVGQLKPITIEQIVQQASDTKEAIRTPVAKLEELQQINPDLRFTPAHEAILNDKLIHVESHLKTALSKVGVEVKAQDIPLAGQKPLVRFLNYLSNSDRQLSTLISEVQGIDQQKKSLQPTQLLALQIKLGFIQTEIEFFTNVLNKAVEGTKTIMNVQI